jgi:deoxyribodipyrimidine photolyase-related protein
LREASRASGANRTEGRRWLYVPYDQLSNRIGPLSREPAGELGIVLVESPWKASRRPYHQQKLALLLANQRHFAIEQARRGVAVRHVVHDGPFREALEPLARELGSLRVMEPAERELRVDLAPLVERGLLEVVPHEGWLTSVDDWARSQRRPPWRMDAFYRHVRRTYGVLMDGSEPLGGRFSFDDENRKPWHGTPIAPTLPRFPPDAITREVGELVAHRFGHHPGTLDLGALPTTAEDAATLWRWALDSCLPSFGPYEDAMSATERTLFHTRISGLLNLHRLVPRDVVRDVEASDAPLASREGFIRQVLGWREYMRHVHRVTDGFRAPPKQTTPIADRPGDGGFSGWRGTPWRGTHDPTIDGGAAPSFLGADRPVPPAFWGARSGLRCLDTVVEGVWAEGYGHHITRLMVLANLATLLDLSPRAITDWFWVAYVDAYDWVVEPNVLAMGTYALGPLATTKPYVAGHAYIDRMSDYCGRCALKRACPVTPMYWAYLDRRRERLAENPRLRLPLASAAKRSSQQRARDAAVARHVAETLARGEPVQVDDLEE